MSRRKFIVRSTLSAAVVTAHSVARAADIPGKESAAPAPLIVSTWPFGKPANEAALRVLEGGGEILDAVEQGIWVTESDPKNGSVGLHGLPNAAGVVQLDASIMSGPGHRAGSVAALEGIRHPISAARRVMEKTRHVLLVGEGARMFALEQGLESVETDAAERNAAWRKKHPPIAAPSTHDATKAKSGNHDTIALLILAADGSIAGGCSTSGLSGKLPGRVGDSPIIGGGLYVDNDVGAAGATGIGENVMRYCGSFMVVEYMRQGYPPEEACLETIRRIARQDPRKTDLSISFVALDKKGRFGAAGSGSGFQFSVTTKQFSRVMTAPGVAARDVGPVGGNRPPAPPR